MAEGVHRGLGPGLEALAADEDHAGGAQGDEALSRFHQPHADGAGRVVAATAGEGHAGRHAPALRQFGLEPARSGAALDQPRHLRARQAAGGQQLVGPVARPHVQPQRARGVRHVARELAAQHEAQPVLGQQHMRDAPEQIGLVLVHPQQLGRGEARHREVAGDGAQPRHARGEGVALGGAAAVIPEDGGAQHLVLRIHSHGAVHLPRQADGAHGRERCRLRAPQLGHDGLQRLPPLRGRLLRP